MCECASMVLFENFLIRKMMFFFVFFSIFKLNKRSSVKRFLACDAEEQNGMRTRSTHLGTTDKTKSQATPTHIIIIIERESERKNQTENRVKNKIEEKCENNKQQRRRRRRQRQRENRLTHTRTRMCTALCTWSTKQTKGIKYGVKTIK